MIVTERVWRVEIGPLIVEVTPSGLQAEACFASLLGTEQIVLVVLEMIVQMTRVVFEYASLDVVVGEYVAEMYNALSLVNCRRGETKQLAPSGLVNAAALAQVSATALSEHA